MSPLSCQSEANCTRINKLIERAKKMEIFIEISKNTKQKKEVANSMIKNFQKESTLNDAIVEHELTQQLDNLKTRLARKSWVLYFFPLNF